MEKTATFAGGCFWCMEPPFRRLDGVKDVVPGYAGGEKDNPTYKEVSAGDTGHLEAVQIVYDDKKVSYKELLDTFWKQIDPTDAFGQFADKGTQYKTAIFYHDDEQKKLAEKSKKDLEKSERFKEPIVTKILPFTNFFIAEEYHHQYYKKHPIQYKLYKMGSGREKFIQNAWKD